MMKMYIYYILIAVLLIVNIALLKMVNGTENKVAENDDCQDRLELNRYYHKQSVSGSQLNNGIKLNAEILLKDLNNKEVSLKKLISTGPKLIIRSNEDGCGLCIEHELKLIKKFMDKIGPQNIILITTHNNVRKLKVFKNDNNITLDVYTCTSLGLPYELVSQKPFLFVIDPSFTSNNFHIPEISETEISEVYYESIISRYFLPKI
ncbi:hypothetical protein [Sphingobacterium sp.]|uniref:hypothetical protein n=1 Tax=Sphingobacterium sp. TaxID=341027 RepID=UPI00258CD42B|nr:hypothetical protein [Sphingobacterium sp.]WET69015.1 MAG: hypothetical protein P0Y57_24540 [Sphingobacterium sp.]